MNLLSMLLVRLSVGIVGRSSSWFVGPFVMSRCVWVEMMAANFKDGALVLVLFLSELPHDNKHVGKGSQRQPSCPSWSSWLEAVS